MYKQVEASSFITITNKSNIMKPVVTLKDEYGHECQIINDDHCYVICLKQDDGTYKPTTHIFKEVFEVLKQMKSPD